MSEEAIPDGASAAPGGAPVAAAAALNSITQYEYSSEDWYTILLAIEVCAPTGLMLMLLFECMRGRDRPVYWPKRRWRRRQTPTKAPSGPLAWLFYDMTLKGVEVAELVGLDAYMLLRYIRLCLRITAMSTFWGLAVLLPLYGRKRHLAYGFYR